MLIKLDVKHDGYMLTQYEHGRKLNEDDLKEYICDEYIQFDTSDIETYNEYLHENNDDESRIRSDLEELLDESDILHTFWLGVFSNVNGNHSYFTLNGYGNIKGYEDYEVESLLNDDSDFKSWYYNNYVEFEDDDIAEKVIREGNRLVARGY